MPIRQALECAVQSGHIQIRSQAHEVHGVVRRAAGLDLLKEPESALPIRERTRAHDGVLHNPAAAHAYILPRDTTSNAPKPSRTGEMTQHFHAL
jgi:hypothetical protein